MPVVLRNNVDCTFDPYLLVRTCRAKLRQINNAEDVVWVVLSWLVNPMSHEDQKARTEVYV